MADQHKMGLGPIGNADVVFKRKFRWTFRVDNICGKQSMSENFVKIAARPSLDIEETEINFLNAKTWIPGKATWQTMTVTYYDVNQNELGPLFSWLSSVYDFTSPPNGPGASLNLRMGSKRSDYSAEGNLMLYDGCGNAMEQWKLQHLWPQAINFGDLDYSSSEECTIELTMRYTNVVYTSMCPAIQITPCCSDCQPGGVAGAVYSAAVGAFGST